MEQPGYTKPEAQRGLGLQLLIAFAFGSFSLTLFSFWRRRWPEVYEARMSRQRELPRLGTSLFGWIPRLLRVTDHEVLRLAGLDAYIFLAFLRLAIAILVRLSAVSLLLLAPLRWLYSGHFDDEDPMPAPNGTAAAFSAAAAAAASAAGPLRDEAALGGGWDAAAPFRGVALDLGRLDPRLLLDRRRPNPFGDYFWVYLASTYAFTLICLWTMRRYNYEVVSVRQAYLGHQRTVTDRTLRISGIPRKLRSEDALGRYVATLFGVQPEAVTLCRQWDRLDEAMARRKVVLRRLEDAWAEYIGPDNPAFAMNEHVGSATPSDRNGTGSRGSLASLGSAYSTGTTGSNTGGGSYAGEDAYSVGSGDLWRLDEGAELADATQQMFRGRMRPLGRVGRLAWLRWWLPRVDLLDVHGRELLALDREIAALRETASQAPATNMAFVTLRSAAQCQLAARALCSPRPHTMVNTLAPAPRDVLWQNVYMHSKQRSITSYVISLVVIVTNVGLFYPITFLVRLLDLQIISAHFPVLGHWLAERKWMAALVTDVLPTFLVSMLNLGFPYFFAWLTYRQGMVSRSDVQLSIISKNFFYVFVNLFLVFTIESTFLSFSVDKFASDFAQWLIRLSSFYTNLVVLQGIGLMPLKLLQPGFMFQFPFWLTRCRTARDHYNLYKPQKINYGIVLPLPMLFFIVSLTYSILRRRILLFGLIYFGAAYFVFKYLLLYTVVNPRHSTGQLWTVVIRRMYLGIAVFHLAMAGVLVQQSAYTYAALIAPLSLLLAGFWFDFERFTRPLLEFVAIEAVRQDEVDRGALATYNLQDGASSFEADQAELDPAELADQTELADELPLHSSGAASSSAAAGSLGDASEIAELRSAALPRVLWRAGDKRAPTLDEVREKDETYTNQSLVAPLDGPWVAANAYESVVANLDGFRRRRIPQAGWL